MNTKDLMLGDWVESRGKIEQVREVYEGYICTDSFEDSHDYYFDPIPLTPEILEKNGFLGTDEPYVSFFGCGKSERKYKRIEFVHELQHAFRLCGIDKEIIL